MLTLLIEEQSRQIELLSGGEELDLARLFQRLHQHHRKAVEETPPGC